MKSICLIFVVNQPFRHRRYRFFDIGNDHYYYDDYSNETSVLQAAEKCYIPAGKLFHKLIEKTQGRFRISFSIPGNTLNLLELYSPETIQLFTNLSKTGGVGFLATPWANSLVSVSDADLFEEQVRRQQQIIKEFFDQEPQVLINTGLIYNDEFGPVLTELGIKGVVTEGARHILGWKSPNFLYCNVLNPRLKVLMRNYKLSDDFTFRFSNTNWSEFPLTAEKFINWLKKLASREEVINIVVPYEVLGMIQPKESGIFDFFDKLSSLVVREKDIKFVTPSEVIDELQPVSAISIPQSVSWSGEERDLSAWFGNQLQNEAYRKLYELKPRVMRCADQEIETDWNYLQDCHHFRLMSTNPSSTVQSMPNHFGSAYEAFINYMNVLSDFRDRLDRLVPENIVEKEIAYLEKIIKERDAKIERLRNQISTLQSQIKPSKRAK